MVMCSVYLMNITKYQKKRNRDTLVFHLCVHIHRYIPRTWWCAVVCTRLVNKFESLIERMSLICLCTIYFVHDYRKWSRLMDAFVQANYVTWTVIYSTYDTCHTCRTYGTVFVQRLLSLLLYHSVWCIDYMQYVSIWLCESIVFCV